MLAVLCSAPRPPLGVALLGLFIAALKGTLYLLPYTLFFSMIGLSLWTPSSPALPDVVYYPVHGQLNMVSVSIVSSPTLKTPSFTLGADLRILIFLLCLPVSSIVENILFRPARDFFLETVVCWFEMRYVQPAQATGLWPDTWAPILNTLRSYEFVAGFLDGVMGNDLSESARNPRGSVLMFWPLQVRAWFMNRKRTQRTYNLPIRTLVWGDAMACRYVLPKRRRPRLAVLSVASVAGSDAASTFQILTSSHLESKRSKLVVFSP